MTREEIRAVDAALRRIIRPGPQLVLWERDSFGLVEPETLEPCGTGMLPSSPPPSASQPPWG